jgi:sulfur-oxidizing protein SoxY
MIRNLAWVFAAGLALHLGAALPAAAAAPESEDGWPALAGDVFKGRPLADGAGLVGLEMPVRAEDAAIVPVTMRVTLPPGDTRYLKTLTLVIDDNPAPVAATFTIGPNAGISTISTRVRVDAYTNVHAVAELSDDKLYVVKTYVKASGGCSAPAAKNADVAAASIGQMKFRQFAAASAGTHERAARGADHGAPPEQSGLQRDQVTLLYIPAHFVDELSVWQGDALLFSMVGASRSPKTRNFRFNLRFPMAPRHSASKPRIPTGSCSGRSGRRPECDPDLRQKQRTLASACARRRSVTAVLACSVVRNWGAEIADSLRHAEHGSRP